MRNLGVILVVSLLAGCAHSPPAVTTSSVDSAAAASKAAAAQRMATEENAEQRLAELARITSRPSPPYTIGAGDVLTVTVYQEPDLSVDKTVVRLDGQISVPLVGEIQAAQRTINEVVSDITKRMSRYVRDPKVNVRIDEPRSAAYTVYGEVSTPGSFTLTGRTTLSSAIARSGGLKQGNYRASTIEIADLRHAFIARNGEVLPVDFVRLLRGGDMRFDVELQPGDHIHIPSGLSQEVYVLGEVTSPMVFAYQDRMALARTLSMSEGFTRDADLTRIHIIRGSLDHPAVTVSNYRQVLTGRERDTLLEPGDIVYVPPTGLATLGNVVDRILPAILAVQNGVLLNQALRK